MFNFCKKILLSLLNISIFSTSPKNSSADHRRPTLYPISGGPVGLAILTAEISKPRNVFESTSIIKFPKKTDVVQASDEIDRWSSISSPAEQERGVTGLSFTNGGGVANRAWSCTELLGFESSNEMSNSNKFENEEYEELTRSNRSTGRSRRVDVKKEVKQFPPPLSTFGSDGKPNFYLRPVRKDGRLELFVERINRPQGLRASRENGRLRLHFIGDHQNTSDDADDDCASNVKGKEKVEEEMESPANSCGGGGGDRHYNMHGW